MKKTIQAHAIAATFALRWTLTLIMCAIVIAQYVKSAAR